MRIYQELFGLYILFGVLVVTLIILVLVLFMSKMKSQRIESDENKSMYIALNNDNNEVPILRYDKKVAVLNASSNEKHVETVIDTMKEIKVLMEETPREGNVAKDKKTLGDEDEKMNMDKIPVATITSSINGNSISAEENPSDINDVKNKTNWKLNHHAIKKELHDRYQAVRKELNKKDKFSIAYEGLTKKADEIGEEMLRVVNLSDDGGDKVTKTIAILIESSLSEIENDMKEALLILELYQRTVPLKIKEKVIQYDELKLNDVKVNNKAIKELKEIFVLLQEYKPKIEAIEFDDIRSELKSIQEKLEAINIEVKDNEK